jgi:hypothetical protein
VLDRVKLMAMRNEARRKYHRAGSAQGLTNDEKKLLGFPHQSARECRRRLLQLASMKLGNVPLIPTGDAA